MQNLNEKSFHKSKLLVEQHFHGCFGINFSTCNSAEINHLAQKLLLRGIGGFFPTLVTDSVENIKRQIKEIKAAKENQTDDMAEILGIHLEGIFINPEKKGIHDEKLFLKPTVENYKLIEDDLIKIVTLAPELDEDSKLQDYLIKQGVKVQAGHTNSLDLGKCSGVTHLFNAMGAISHRAKSAALSALIDDRIYTEVIADGIHLSKDILQLVFKCKPFEKIILVSDSLPIARSNLESTNFAGAEIRLENNKAVNKDGTLAGSAMILDEVVACLAREARNNPEDFIKMASDNLYEYHNIQIDGCIYWDEDFNIVAVEKGKNVFYKSV